MVFISISLLSALFNLTKIEHKPPRRPEKNWIQMLTTIQHLKEVVPSKIKLLLPTPLWRPLVMPKPSVTTTRPDSVNSSGSISRLLVLWPLEISIPTFWKNLESPSSLRLNDASTFSTNCAQDTSPN